MPLLWPSSLLYDWLAQGGGPEYEFPKNPSITSEEGEHSGAARLKNGGRQIPEMPPTLRSIFAAPVWWHHDDVCWAPGLAF